MQSRSLSEGNSQPNYRYQVGGSLPFHAPSYVTRASDITFYEHLQKGEFCYVLNSRQMGKSSLRVQTMQKLREQGVVCAAIDLTGFGTQGITPEKWYGGFIKALVNDCQLKLNWQSWWERQDPATPVQRLHMFIEQVLLQDIQQNIVVFIDEIDLILSQHVSVDDFLALIRFFYNQRVDRPAYQRLTFALLGVTTPSALMQDHERTPFNIGKAIYLEGFKIHEALPLAEGLRGKVDNPERILQEILDWTGGQPFLTQRLCQRMEASVQADPEISVDQVVQTQIIENWEAQDEPVHLRTICDRILFNERKSVQLLGLYQKVYGGKVATTSSPEHIELRLSGLVKDHQGTLTVYNRIYSQIFNPQWIQKTLGDLRPYASTFEAWEQSQRRPEKLLTGKALKQSLNWAVGKSLSDSDYDFIRLSQVKAEQEKLQRKIFIRNLLAVLGMGGLLLGSILWGSDRWQADQTQENLAKITQLHDKVAQAKRENRPIKALSLAIESGQKLRSLVQEQPLSTYPTTTPLLDLQQLLDQDKQPTLPENKRWNLQTLKEEAIWDLDISPDGRSLAVSGWGNSVRVLQRHSQQQLAHSDAEMVISTDFSFQGDHVATASLNGNIKLWSTSSGKSIQSWNTKQVAIWSTRFSPQGKYLATAGWDGTVRLWDLAGKQHFHTSKNHQAPVKDIRFSPNGQWLTSAGEDGMIRLWKLCLDPQCPTADDSQPLGLFKKWKGHRGWIWSLDISPDSKLLASAGEDGILRFWNLEQLDMQPKRWQMGLGRVTQVRFSPDGQWLAMSGWDGTVQIRDRNGRIFSQWQSDRPVTSLSFTPDQKRLLAGTVMGNVHQWPIQTLDQLLNAGCEQLQELNASQAQTVCAQ